MDAKTSARATGRLVGLFAVLLLLAGCGGEPAGADTRIAGRSGTDWIRILCSNDAAAERDAERELANAGPSGVAVLVDALHDPGARWAAGKGLALLGARAVPVLQPILERDPDVDARVAAVAVLVDLGAPGSSLLASALADEAPRVRAAAAEGLAKRGDEAGFAAAALVRALVDDGLGVADAARRALRALPAPEVVTALGEATRSKDPALQGAAAVALGRLDARTISADLRDRAVADLRALVAGADADVGLRAALALRALAPDTDVTDALRRALRSGTVESRRAAIAAVRDLDLGEGGLPLASEGLAEADALVRRGSVRVLGAGGPAAAPYVAALAERLGDADDGVRTAAATSLGAIGAKADLVVPALENALADASPDVRVSAASALGAYGPEASSAVARLVAAVTAVPHRPEHEDVMALRRRVTALVVYVTALGRIAKDDAGVVRVLTELVGDDARHPDARTAAANALAKMGEAAHSSFDALLQASWSENDALRSAASAACLVVDPDRAKESARMIGRRLPAARLPR